MFQYLSGSSDEKNHDKDWRINEIRTAAFGPEKAGVGGSTPSLATIFSIS